VLLFRHFRRSLFVAGSDRLRAFRQAMHSCCYAAL
jgi:hypothetical protein